MTSETQSQHLAQNSNVRGSLTSPSQRHTESTAGHKTISSEENPENTRLLLTGKVRKNPHKTKEKLRNNLAITPSPGAATPN